MTATQKIAKRYVVRMELRDDNTVKREAMVVSPDYKYAWELARKACRLGKMFDGQEPGAWTVRKVYTEQSSVAPTQAVLTAARLIEVLTERGLELTDEQLGVWQNLEDEVKSPPALS
jgi:hypothetical protein